MLRLAKSISLNSSMRNIINHLDDSFRNFYDFEMSIGGLTFAYLKRGECNDDEVNFSFVDETGKTLTTFAAYFIEEDEYGDSLYDVYVDDDVDENCTEEQVVDLGERWLREFQKKYGLVDEEDESVSLEQGAASLSMLDLLDKFYRQIREEHGVQVIHNDSLYTLMWNMIEAQLGTEMKEKIYKNAVAAVDIVKEYFLDSTIQVQEKAYPLASTHILEKDTEHLLMEFQFLNSSFTKEWRTKLPDKDTVLRIYHKVLRRDFNTEGYLDFDYLVSDEEFNNAKPWVASWYEPLEKRFKEKAISETKLTGVTGIKSIYFYKVDADKPSVVQFDFYVDDMAFNHIYNKGGESDQNTFKARKRKINWRKPLLPEWKDIVTTAEDFISHTPYSIESFLPNVILTPYKRNDNMITFYAQLITGVVND